MVPVDKPGDANARQGSIHVMQKERQRQVSQSDLEPGDDQQSGRFESLELINTTNYVIDCLV